jgi:hypothetical protein
MQYVKAGRALFILVSPRINIDSDPLFSVFSIVRYRPDIAGNTKLYLGMRLLNIFDPDRHIKSYQWLRAGFLLLALSLSWPHTEVCDRALRSRSRTAKSLGSSPIDLGLHPHHARSAEEAIEWPFLNTPFTTSKS